MKTLSQNLLDIRLITESVLLRVSGLSGCPGDRTLDISIPGLQSILDVISMGSVGNIHLSLLYEPYQVNFSMRKKPFLETTMRENRNRSLSKEIGILKLINKYV